jgi:hypothetical protein
MGLGFRVARFSVGKTGSACLVRRSLGMEIHRPTLPLDYVLVQHIFEGIDLEKSSLGG